MKNDKIITVRLNERYIEYLKLISKHHEIPAEEFNISSTIRLAIYYCANDIRNIEAVEELNEIDG